jgi:hypothetical protein
MIAVKPVYKTTGISYNRTTPTIDDAPYRTDIVRATNRYDDLARQIIITFKTYQEVESKIAPLVARNSGNLMFILSKEGMLEIIKNSFGMNNLMFSRFLDGIERFYAKHKMMKRLPSPHIISHRSVHFGESLFHIEQVDVEQYLKLTQNRDRNYKVSTVHKIEVGGLDPFYIENMRRGNYKYIVLRPKLGKSGAPMPDKWEILLYNTNLGYNVEHVDSDKNPRYNGTL